MLREKGKKVIINNIDDVWAYINLLKEESDDNIKQGSSFTSLNNIYEQLPFFCCTNHILNEECQEDIMMYVYCSETRTPAYAGSYNDTPSVWIEKYKIIKQAIAIRDKKIMEKNNARQ